MKNYHSILILVLMLVVYGLSYGLVKFKKIGLMTHRKLWNIILLVSFLVSAVLGIVLAITWDQKIIGGWYRQMVWWHVETGIVMAVISIFHALWHGQYYLSLIKKKKI